MMRDYDSKLVDQAVKTIQMLAADGVEKAGCGHPGAPMGLAAIAFEIYTRHLRYDPSEPNWPDRDRFVMSCGHASMLVYGMLHLAGYDVSMDDLKSFRQWGSNTPGHPEVHVTPGVETTTGPLGQGLANAVGMAAGQKMLASRFNDDSGELFSGRTFGIVSDGDLMEGVASEAASLAGHLQLDNLVFFYDDNSITIDGGTELAFSENVAKRFEAYGWHVATIDGHDHADIRKALDAAVAHVGQPSLIVAKTIIGKGAPNKQGTSGVHGSKLGADELKATKENLGWPLEPTFLVPDEVRSLFAERADDGKNARAEWTVKYDALVKAGGDKKALYDAIMGREIPANLLDTLLAAAPEKDSATRNQSGVILQAVAKAVPALVGGSADLTPSTKTYLKGSDAIGPNAFAGRNIHFGVREHAMGAFANGLALIGGFIPYTATFMVFSDYMRPAMRLASLSHVPSIFVFTHDSVFLGEDGPTHQPVEHYWAIRVIPNHDLVRPADAMESAAAWVHALNRTDGPTSFALTRQGVPNLPRAAGFDPSVMLKGAYVLDDAAGVPKAVIVATGSEVHLAIEAKKLLGEAGKSIRVVSAPCLEAFDRQDQAYRDSVFPAGVKRCSIEAGISMPWRGIVGDGGLTIGHDGFGASAPLSDLQENFGFTPKQVAAKIQAWL